LIAPLIAFLIRYEPYEPFSAVSPVSVGWDEEATMAYKAIEPSGHAVHGGGDASGGGGRCAGGGGGGGGRGGGGGAGGGGGGGGGGRGAAAAAARWQHGGWLHGLARFTGLAEEASSGSGRGHLTQAQQPTTSQLASPGAAGTRGPGRHGGRVPAGPPWTPGTTPGTRVTAYVLVPDLSAAEAGSLCTELCRADHSLSLRQPEGAWEGRLLVEEVRSLLISLDCL
jgi:hypothetical protein